MRTKSIFLFFLAAGLFAVACDKASPVQEPVVDPAVVEGTNNLVQLTVGIKGAFSAPQTRADTEDGTVAENTINNIQVFVFKKSGTDYVFESSVRATTASTVLAVTSGTKNIIVLVNEPIDYTLTDPTNTYAIQDREDLYAAVSNMKDNARDSFRMVGEKVDFTLDGSSASATCTVPVSRLAARIEIKKITNSLLYGYATQDVKVVRAYLTWAPQKVSFDINATDADVADMHYYTNFYATVGINTKLDLDGTLVSVAAEKAAVNDLAYKAISSSVVSNGAAYSEPIVLYCLPNNNAELAAGGHPTHVVVEMLIGGKYYTYPIELPELEMNHSYQINNLILKHIGNASDGDDDLEGEEDKPITLVETTFELEVQPWTLVNLTYNDANGWVI